MSDDQLALESVVTHWTVREVLCHMSRVMEIAFAMMVRRAKRNKGMPKVLHTRLARWLNYRTAKQAAKGADRDEVLKRYDAANAKMVRPAVEGRRQPVEQQHQLSRVERH